MIVSQRRLRNAARGRVHQAIKKGDLKKPSNYKCVDCGEPAQCWEHRDYTKPLDVVPTCKSCDMQRGPGFPPMDSGDMEIDWITRDPPKAIMRWGVVDYDSRILHRWNVTGKNPISLCGMERRFPYFTVSFGIRKCKKCEVRND